MESGAYIHHLNELLQAKRLAWTKEDYQRLSGKGTPRGRLLGFMTRGYYQRERVWQTGRIVYGYAYKTYTDRDYERPYLVWILFSPMSIFESEPNHLVDIHVRLEPFLDNTKAAGKYRRLINALTNPLTEPKYFSIPGEFTDGKLVYVSTLFADPGLHDQMPLGLVPIVIAPEISQEIMLVPERHLAETAEVAHQ
jgi:hypothetical protein